MYCTAVLTAVNIKLIVKKDKEQDTLIVDIVIFTLVLGVLYVIAKVIF